MAAVIYLAHQVPQSQDVKQDVKQVEYANHKIFLPLVFGPRARACGVRACVSE